MKRIISLILSAILVFGVLITPNFAIETAGQKLQAHGFIQGYGNGNLGESDLLTRAQLAKLIAELYNDGESAAKYTKIPNYTDTYKISPWAIPYVAYAQTQGWITGKSDAKGNIFFDPDGYVKPAELATVLLRVLGYYRSYNSSLVDAQQLGITISYSPKLTRGEAFASMWTAVSEIVAKGDTVVLGVKLGKLGNQNQPSNQPSTGIAAVSNVISNNLKKFVIEFGKAIDPKSMSKDTVKVTFGSVNILANTKLDETGTKLQVEFGARRNNDKVKLTLKDIKTTSGETISFEKEYTLLDTAVPQLVGVSALNQKEIVLEFSEPMFAVNNPYFTVYNNIKVDGVNAVARLSTNSFTNTLTVLLNKELSTGTHNISFTDIYDFAGFKTDVQNREFTVVQDKTPPVATKLEVLDLNTLRLTFNKDIITAGLVRVDGIGASSLSIENNNQLRITLARPLGIAALVEIKVEYQGQYDKLGNSSSRYNTILTKMEDDTLLPTVSVKHAKGTNIEFTFSKPMQYAKGKVIIVDSKDRTIHSLDLSNDATAKNKWGNNFTELTLTIPSFSNVDKENYKAKLSGFYDNTFRQNPLISTELTFTSLDTKKPELLSAYKSEQVQGGRNITLYFSEELESSSALNQSNYRIGGRTLSTISGAYIVGMNLNNKEVVLFVPSGVDGSIEAIAIKDLSGNMIVTGTFATMPVSQTIHVQQSTVETKNKISIKFSEKIASADPNFLTVIDQKGNYYKPMNATIDKDNAQKVVFEFSEELPTTGLSGKVFDYDIWGVVSVYGTTINSRGIPSLTLTDSVGASAKEVKYISPNKFEVKFSETIKYKDGSDESNYKYDVVIKLNGEIIPLSNYSIQLSGDTATYTVLNITETNYYDVEISQVAQRVLQDQSGNFVSEWTGPVLNVELVQTP